MNNSQAQKYVGNTFEKSTLKIGDRIFVSPSKTIRKNKYRSLDSFYKIIITGIEFSLNTFTWSYIVTEIEIIQEIRQGLGQWVTLPFYKEYKAEDYLDSNSTNDYCIDRKQIFVPYPVVEVKKNIRLDMWDLEYSVKHKERFRLKRK